MRTLVLALVAWLAAAPAAAGDAPIRVGVLAYRGGDHASAVWEPTVRYLAGRFPGRGAEMMALDLPGMDAAVRDGRVDFVLTNTGNYVELEARYGVTRIATLRSSRASPAHGAVGSAVIVPAGRQDLRSLADLRGRTVMAADADAFGGFQVAWGEMLKAGVDPFADFKELRFSGFPVDRVAFAVRDGLADAGILRACLLEEMAAEGRIDLADFRVLGARHPAGYGCALSTPLYPDWPFARLAGTPEDLAKAVVVALFEMTADDPAARAGDYVGWTVPLDYQPVHELFRALRIGPYRHLRDVSVVDVLRRHWEWLALAALALAWWAVHSLRVEHLVKVRTAELRRAQEEARRRQVEMDHVSRLSILGEMAGSLAHELNQPLGAISNYARGCSRRLAAGNSDPAVLAQAAEAIAEQAERAGRIIARIRDFVRKREARVEQVDVNAAVRAALAMCEGRARGRGIGLDTRLDPALPPVLADRVQVEQVVLNLAVNALDAMEGRPPTADGLTVTTATDPRGRVCISVADRGPGLGPEAGTRLFEPFFTTKAEGMGLGLSICRTIVETYGGHLSAGDNPGGGAVLHVVLPAAPEEPPP